MLHHHSPRSRAALMHWLMLHVGEWAVSRPHHSYIYDLPGGLHCHHLQLAQAVLELCGGVGAVVHTLIK